MSMDTVDAHGESFTVVHTKRLSLKMTIWGEFADSLILYLDLPLSHLLV